MSTPAARICGPPMPKIFTSARSWSAVARRAAYISPEASPAESRRGMGGIFAWGHDTACWSGRRVESEKLKLKKKERIEEAFRSGQAGAQPCCARTQRSCKAKLKDTAIVLERPEGTP